LNLRAGRRAEAKAALHEALRGAQAIRNPVLTWQAAHPRTRNGQASPLGTASRPSTTIPIGAAGASAFTGP
jgi:hypothetical protein